jgi:hypothetical protein
MAMNKLNKIAKMYTAASAISDNAKPKGSAEEMEEAAQKGAEKNAEEHSEKTKRRKKLKFSDDEGATVDSDK